VLTATGTLLPVYAQMPVKPVSGRGSWIIDEDGARWLDAYAGHAVTSTGHCHPHVVAAITRQAGELLFYSALLPHPSRDQLARDLVAMLPAGLDKVFFANSGAEANENLMMLARRRTQRTTIVALEGGWHGRTMACQAVTDGPKYVKNATLAGMPLAPRVPFNDIAALEAALTSDVAALLIEPVQGVAGARDVSREFLEAARRLCTERGTALLFDEVQSGIGRCGAFTAAQLYGVTPDGMSLAKGLASGVPIGCTVVNEWLSEGIQIGDLGSTFGGGPLACAAAIATLEVVRGEDLSSHAGRIGAQLRAGIAGLPGVTRLQGHGLFIGIVTEQPAKQVQQALFAEKVLTGTSDDPHVLRLLPPLNFSSDEADLVIAALARVLAA
jgi:acetylornithine/succinyldiaminopimelate/putrescine aminotransferase